MVGVVRVMGKVVVRVRRRYVVGVFRKMRLVWLAWVGSWGEVWLVWLG